MVFRKSYKHLSEIFHIPHRNIFLFLHSAAALHREVSPDIKTPFFLPNAEADGFRLAFAPLICHGNVKTEFCAYFTYLCIYLKVDLCGNSYRGLCHKPAGQAFGISYISSTPYFGPPETHINTPYSVCKME